MRKRAAPVMKKARWAARPSAIIKATATIEGPGEIAWEVLDRLAKVYTAPDADFPAPRAAGYLVRYSIQKVSGVGPWAA